MATKMACEEFFRGEDADLEEAASGRPGAIPPGVYYLVDDSRVLLLTEKVCKRSQ